MAQAEFNWEDPLDLESQLTDEERMIRDSARAFAQDKLMPTREKPPSAMSASTARS
jgi:glutaryl-CoA dehydrogenase